MGVTVFGGFWDTSATVVSLTLPYIEMDIFVPGTQLTLPDMLVFGLGAPQTFPFLGVLDVPGIRILKCTKKKKYIALSTVLFRSQAITNECRISQFCLCLIIQGYS